MTDALDEGLPRALALTWGIAAHPQRGPKRELSIERIIEAAVEIADAEGLSGVTMSKVASVLGFTTMSLYRYVTSKDDLLLLMQEMITAFPVPAESDSADWEAGLRGWVITIRNCYLDHPWLLDIPVSELQLMTPNNLLVVDWALREMRQLPLNEQEKMSVILTLSGLTRTFGLMQRDIESSRQSVEPGVWEKYGAALAELVTESQFPDLFPVVHAGRYVGGADDGFDDFKFAVRLVFDGVIRHVELGGTASDPAAGERGADVAGTPVASDPGAGTGSDELEQAVSKDKGVREAARERREAEAKLREALKREKDARKRARERTVREAEKAQRAAEKAARAAEKPRN
ncbi:TetR/AcrR family transcriptional regulator [Saxibacter everestensis]|uniref:TetR/AcrR family transcriptional regulator n=1 Tax=Saxibacter everestensis TaxID=2909229 RepID=A0ABY8QQI1_9MICO|nr:TetR/AcrR family transcriptional regulator [Brevibacteriaceae bacterium ZFBP1038]